MKYTLRNKDSLSLKYPPRIVDRVISSLDKVFSEGSPMERYSHFDTSVDPCPRLVIEDSGHSVYLIAFYIVGMANGVVDLEFAEFIG